jgi:hypothetical protein
VHRKLYGSTPNPSFGRNIEYSTLSSPSYIGTMLTFVSLGLAYNKSLDELLLCLCGIRAKYSSYRCLFPIIHACLLTRTRHDLFYNSLWSFSAQSKDSFWKFSRLDVCLTKLAGFNAVLDDVVPPSRVGFAKRQVVQHFRSSAQTISCPLRWTTMGVAIRNWTNTSLLLMPCRQIQQRVSLRTEYLQVRDAIFSSSKLFILLASVE